MSRNTVKKQALLSISDLYPDLTPEQQAEAEHNLAKYLAVVKCIFERTENLTG